MWLVELVDTFASLVRQGGGNLYIVGFSRGTWYTTTIISKLSQGGVTRAVLLAPYFHGDNKVDQADVLASAAERHGTELLVVASRADASCVWAAEECGISRLCRPQHAVVIYDTYGHEDVRDAFIVGRHGVDPNAAALMQSFLYQHQRPVQLVSLPGPAIAWVYGGTSDQVPAR